MTELGDGDGLAAVEGVAAWWQVAVGLAIAGDTSESLQLLSHCLL
jgi:hypothetical protein